MNHPDQEGTAFIQDLFADAQARQLVRGNAFAQEAAKILKPTTVKTELPAVVKDNVEVFPAKTVVQFTDEARVRLEQEQVDFGKRFPMKVVRHKLGGISLHNNPALRGQLRANSVERGRDAASAAEDDWVEGYKQHESALESQSPLGALSAQQAVEVIPEPPSNLVNIRSESV